MGIAVALKHQKLGFHQLWWYSGIVLGKLIKTRMN